MSEVPARARTAAVLLLIYGALVVVAGVAGHAHPAGTTTTNLFRTAVRVIGIVIISGGLFRGAHWAWLLGVVFGGFWLLMSFIGAAALITSGEGAGVSLYALIHILAVVTALAGAWILLLTRAVRQAYSGR